MLGEYYLKFVGIELLCSASVDIVVQERDRDVDKVVRNEELGHRSRTPR
jgi:hypothetical protein